MWRRFASSLVIPALCVLCFFTGTMVGDSPTPAAKPEVRTTNICGTEGDTCPMSCLPNDYREN